MDVKQIIFVRKDLGMSRGLLASQCSHASIKVFFNRMTIFNEFAPNNTGSKYFAKIYDINEAMKYWMEKSFTLVIFSCHAEEDLLDLQKKAEALQLPNALMKDDILREFSGKLILTALAIGPAKSEILDPLVEGYNLL